MKRPVLEGTTSVPDFTPDEIARIFNEATTCFAVGAYDASGAMFRKVIDNATRPLVGDNPETEDRSRPDHIAWKTIKDLRLRLDWLIARNRLPRDIEDLVSCVHQDGNEAAHALETIGRDSALDLQDFTVAILEALYTRPGRIAENRSRRDERKQKSG